MRGRRLRTGPAAVALSAVALAPGAAWAPPPDPAPRAAGAERGAGPATGASDRAIARWLARVAALPADADAWTSLGEALVQKARETADAAHYRRAEAAFRKALPLEPRHADALAGMAWVHGALHEFEESARWARRALAVDPEHPRAHGLLGDAAMELGDYEAALDHYQTMIDLRPDLGSYSRAAHLLYVTGQHGQAVALMEKAIAAGAAYAENTAWARAQLALLLAGHGALEPAEAALRVALREAPRNPHVLGAMGKVRGFLGDHEGAIEHYRRSIAIAPLHDAVVALGDLYVATGRREEADKQYALVEVIDRLNRAAGVRGNLQMARFHADHDRNLADALREAEAAYRVQRSVYAADTLAWCYYKNGRLEEARRAIARALAHGTPDAEILFHAGMIHARLEERTAARAHLARALALNPRFHPIHAATAADTLRALGGPPPR